MDAPGKENLLRCSGARIGTDADDCLTRRAVCRLRGLACVRCGGCRGGHAGVALLTHIRIELVHVRLRIGKADPVPCQNKVTQNVIRIPLSRVGRQEENGHHVAGVMEIHHARRKRVDAGIFYDERHGIVHRSAGEAAASRHIHLDKDVKEARSRQIISGSAARP